MKTNKYKQRILESIMDGEYLFEHKNFGVFYSAGEGLVAKIFTSPSSKETSLQEFENLKKLKDLKDSRIKIPEVYDRFYLGEDKEIRVWMGNDDHVYSEQPLYAVVMELFEGKHWSDNMTVYERRRYSKSIIKLMDALIAHKINIGDLKPEEIICLKNSNKVGLVDTHMIGWGNISDYTQHLYMGLYEEAKKARWNMKLLFSK